MSSPPAPGPWSDDEFPCDAERRGPIVPRRPLRRDLQDAHATASERLSQIDAALEALVQRRRLCLHQLDRLRARLNRRWSDNHVRRHGQVDEPPMPPALPDARALHGDELRQVCLTLLRRHGPLELRALHGLIHQYGYTVGGTRPVQRLGDAMAYETRCGRTARVARGCYAARDEGPHRVRQLGGITPPPAPLVPWTPRITDVLPPLVDPPVLSDPEHWSAGWSDETDPDQPAEPAAGDPGDGDDRPAGDQLIPEAIPAAGTLVSALGDDSSTNRPRGRGGEIPGAEGVGAEGVGAEGVGADDVGGDDPGTDDVGGDDAEAGRRTGRGGQPPGGPAEHRRWRPSSRWRRRRRRRRP
jgi:hypothetical protein